MENDAVVYEIPPDEAVALTEGLLRVWEKLGKPTDLSVATGWIMMDNIMQIWTKFFPWEVEAWKHDLAIDLANEKTIKALNADDLGLHDTIAFPPILFNLIKAMFPDLKVSDRKFVKQMADRYPLLKTTNYNL